MATSRSAASMSPSMRLLVDFYDPTVEGQDHAGRTLNEILKWDDAALERSHNFIQTLFPLPEGSIFSFTAPIVDEATMLYFRQRTALQENVLRALVRMVQFYGFDVQIVPEFRLQIEPSADCAAGFDHWFMSLNHNHLRITRILRSLRVLGLGGAAQDFYDALIAVCTSKTHEGVVSKSSIAYWTRAVNNELAQAPDGTFVDWLEKYN